MSNMPEPMEGHEDIDEVCSDLHDLIESKKADGDDVSMLEKAYKMLEKAKGDPKDESMATMPLAKARAKVQAFKLPPVPKGEPMSSPEEESPESGY
jgi:hypothetical protein